MLKSLNLFGVRSGLILLAAMFAVTAMPAISNAQQSDSTGGLNQLKFLLGDWIGEGSGQPGEATGGFTFSMDLQNHVMVRRNYADYPPMKDKPAYKHEDLMIIYSISTDTLRAIFFDNEDHVINYDVNPAPDKKSAIFISPATGQGWRYRLTMAEIDDKNMSIKFEMAPPADQNKFSTYIDAKAHRK
jgi:hypothetical protein